MRTLASRKNNTAPVSGTTKATKRVSVLGVVGLAATTGIAAAAILSQVGFTGSVARGNFTAQFVQPITVALQEETTPGQWNEGTTIQGGTLSSDGKTFDVPTGVEVYYGTRLYLGSTVTLKTGTARRGYISGLTGTLPAGWRLDLSQGCGVVISGDNNNSSSTTAAFILKPTSESAAASVPMQGLGVKVEALPQGSALALGSTVNGITCAPIVGS